ncbi:G-protein coupled receptor 54-like [Saccoglossus kowalevskii]|uniref:G-protein coupled receptor 54-like n=1 Tax=Saccoglossus kowalevskii TaxID=10224 RepID=A0ABM0GNA8_SACKO|nr:PREDICTED: G-protein coupled receptor 54-like [Saccoglossus kowalevskii]
MEVANYSSGMSLPGLTLGPFAQDTMYMYRNNSVSWDPSIGDSLLHNVSVSNSTANTTDISPPIVERPDGAGGLEITLVPIFFAMIVFIGVTGNSIVLYIILKHKEMQTVTNYYIANLALADITFLVICTTSTAALYATPQWYLGDFTCRFAGYMQYVSVQATCATLTAMTVDRHFLIVHAVRSRNATIRKPMMAMMISVFIWIGAFLLHVPVAIYTRQVIDSDGEPYCRRIFPDALAHKMYEVYSFIVMYILPLVIITVCYTMILQQVWRRTSSGTESAQAIERSIRRKRKITRMVLIVVVLFAICWGPLQIMNQWMILDVKYPYESHPVYHFRIFCLCLAYTNSCVNPFVYAFTTNSFRKYFKRLFSACCPHGNGFTHTSVTKSTRMSDKMSRTEDSVSM